MKSIKATCLKCPRTVKCSLSGLPPELSEEYEFVKEKILEEAKVCHSPWLILFNGYKHLHTLIVEHMAQYS